MVRARLEIGKLQRRLWQRQKRLISRSVHEAGEAFRTYEARYLRRVRSFTREAGYDELLREISRAGVVYVGDYHTLKQSQRSFLKLLQAQKRPVVLALEFLQGRHQATLDAYLAGRISKERFLEAIDYGRHAVFDTWPHFEPIFDEARRRKLPVVAIDLSATSLAARDEYAARRIAQAARAHPDAQIFVLAGQLHVAPPHLPAAVARRAPGLKPLVVYQNCERIWWSLQRDHRELEAHACLVRPGEYCLINTPPVVVQQSYLDWIEGGVEPLDGANPEARFRFLARTIARFLGLETRAFREALSQVAVYTAGDLSFLDTLPVSAKERRQIEQQILSRESYYIPRARIAYLANLSVNHAAEEAAHFVRNVISGAGDEPRELADAFYARALEEAYAFCGSKIVNPRRKCPHEPQFERLRKSSDAFTRQVARCVLAHRAAETGGRSRATQRLSKAGPTLFNAVTHSLGYMLGERLYYALATGVCSKSYVRELFLDPLEDEGEPFAVYMMLSRRLAEVRIPKRV
ncbi:MAG TPA: ChaN family lipoprotein [Myxococcales bacterium]|nr:ChaN family lipoprotein [Myxococcales bacterium]